MFFKRFILLIASLIFIMLLYRTDFIAGWLDRFIFPKDNPLTNQVGDNGQEITGQFSMMEMEQRKARRYGNTYLLCQYMTKFLDTTKIKNGPAVILLPPNDYLRSIGSSFTLAEPAEMYYHSGLKTIWANNPDTVKANWAVVPMGKGSMAFVPITSKDQLHQLLNTYKNFKPSL